MQPKYGIIRNWVFCRNLKANALVETNKWGKKGKQMQENNTCIAQKCDVVIISKRNDIQGI